MDQIIATIHVQFRQPWALIDRNSDYSIVERTTQAYARNRSTPPSSNINPSTLLLTSTPLLTSTHSSPRHTPPRVNASLDASNALYKYQKAPSSILYFFIACLWPLGTHTKGWQESAEFVAWINHDLKNKGVVEWPMRLLIAQDHDEIYLCVAEYDEGYIKFLAEENSPVIKDTLKKLSNTLGRTIPFTLS
ncbi:hypothetical protein ACN42_g5277 [Penicillium freii]|uniref:Uncharacterized protein n=1 Tax=Penicillium freii TaxID=48697 RepID=A0A101MJR4_PENFR|nr:hypothetical protein ACN42_g5277 [Penicillium freii]